jgi:XTP/dITP diphosphohydrolase
MLATGNQGKVKELQELLALIKNLGKVFYIKDYPDYPDVEETGSTFKENALLKAREAAKRTKLISLADDSGLEVDILGGEPGVHSARFAGEPKDDDRNIDKLLKSLEGVPEDQRQARFKCSLAIVTPDGQEFVTEGTVEGRIIFQRIGSGGFGYDPVFYVSEYGKTMAELPLEEKNRISHRAQAFDKALSILKNLLD